MIFSIASKCGVGSPLASWNASRCVRTSRSFAMIEGS
jgi:hypothetical protein